MLRKFDMAKRPQLLSEKISALFDAFESAPIPATDRIKNGLWEFANDAKAMEDGERSAEAKAEIAALEKKAVELEALNKTQAANFNSELEQLQLMVEAANAEVNRLREAQEERKKKSARRTDEHEELILISLGSGFSLPSGGVAVRLNVGFDRADVLLSRLKADGLVEDKMGKSVLGDDEVLWHLTLKGKEYLVDHNLDWNPDRPARKHPDLVEGLELILEGIATGGRGGLSSERVRGWLALNDMDLTLMRVDFDLKAIRAKGFIGQMEDEEGVPMDSWSLTDLGDEYLAERGKL